MNVIESRIEVVLESDGTAVSRVGGVSVAIGYSDINDNTKEWFYPGNGGYMSYPDLRATKFRVYIRHHGDAHYKMREWDAIASKKANLAYVDLGNRAAPTSGTPPPNFGAGVIGLDFNDAKWSTGTYTDDILDAKNATYTNDPNRILVSMAFKPRLLYGHMAQYVGLAADDGPIAFAAAAKEISLGQFGQYPLYVFCSAGSIFAMQVADDGVGFKAVTPLATGRPILGPNAVALVDRTIYYATDAGVFSIPDQDAPLSYPIQNSDSPNDILSAMGPDTALVHFTDRPTGRNELWVSTPARTYAFSFEAKRWFTLDATNTVYLRAGEKLFGVNRDGILDQQAAGTPATGRVVLYPVTFGEPDIVKRFRKIIVRLGSMLKVLAGPFTDYEFDVTFNNVTTPLVAIDVWYELRYSHRVRIRSDQRVLPPWGYGYVEYDLLYANLQPPSGDDLVASTYQITAPSVVFTGSLE